MNGLRTCMAWCNPPALAFLITELIYTKIRLHSIDFICLCGNIMYHVVKRAANIEIMWRMAHYWEYIKSALNCRLFFCAHTKSVHGMACTRSGKFVLTSQANLSLLCRSSFTVTNIGNILRCEYLSHCVLESCTVYFSFELIRKWYPHNFHSMWQRARKPLKLRWTLTLFSYAITSCFILRVSGASGHVCGAPCRRLRRCFQVVKN